jgi:PAS domain S-box-containing protein
VITIDPTILRLAAVVESTDDGVISVALDGTIQTWNRGAVQIFGYEAPEALGASIDLIVPLERRREEQVILARVRTGKAVSHFETQAVTRSGEIRPISLTISPVLTAEGELIGFSRIARDVSRQKALERDVLRLAAIVDYAEDAIISKDLNGIVQTWNKGAERMFGYSADEMIGRSITVIIPQERIAEEDAVLSRIRAGVTTDHFETIRRRKDGSFIEISLSVSPIRTPDGTVIGASKIARDITVQRQLMRAAAEANRVKDEFLAMLSHELRTPLNAVLGYTRMLRLGQIGEDRQERAIDIIERNANVLSQLVSDVLDVSSIVTGKIRLKPMPADLGVLIGNAADSLRPSAEAKGISLLIHSPDAPVPTRCDPDRIQQVLWNLLSNAIKFTARGGEITMRLVEGDRSAEVSVSDTGIGIRPDLLPYVFQRFWQGEGQISRQTGGLGLGLALARHFVELHGGTIHAASAGEGQGATFTIRLPLSVG